MSNYRNLDRKGSNNDYDVKTIGGRQIVVWKTKENKQKLHSGNYEEAQTLNGTPIRASSFPYLQNYQTPDYKLDSKFSKSNSAPMDRAVKGITSLPPISKNSSSQSAHVPDSKNESNYLGKVEEVRLKLEMNRALHNVSDKAVDQVLTELQQLDVGLQGALLDKQISAVFAKHKIAIGPDTFQLLVSKFSYPGYHGVVDYEKMMIYIMRSKRQPQVPIPNLKKNSSQASSSRTWFSTAGSSRLEQDEMRLLNELGKQLSKSKVDLATLHRHFNEMDRERKGVLTRTQIESILKRNGINLSTNVMDTVLHYCDKDGYRLYNTAKFLEFFTWVVREDKAFMKPSDRHIRMTRVRSPPPRPVPPTLEESSKPEELLDFGLEDEDFYADPPFDRNEWMRRYNSLARAIYSSHQELPGYLPADEVQHIAETYNLVYNLQISKNMINRTISNSYDPRTKEVDIRQFVFLLQNDFFSQSDLPDELI